MAKNTTWDIDAETQARIEYVAYKNKCRLGKVITEALKVLELITDEKIKGNRIAVIDKDDEIISILELEL